MQSSSELAESYSASQSNRDGTENLEPTNRGQLYPNMSKLLSAIELEDENAQLKLQVEYLKKTLHNKEDEMYQLEEELASLSAKYRNLLIDHERRMYELEADSDEKLAQLRDKLNQQKQEYRDLEKRIENDQVESGDYKAKYQNLAQNLELVKQQRDTNRSDHQEAMGERDQARHELKDARSSIEQLESLNADKQQELVELSGQAVKLQNWLDKQIYEKSVLYTKAKNYDLVNNKLEIMMRFYEKVKALYATSNDRNIDLSAEIDELKKQLFDKMVDESEKGQDYYKMKKTMNNFDEEMELKMDIITSLEDDLTEAKKLQTRYKEEIEKLQDVAAKSIRKQEQLQNKFEGEMVSQEVLKMAIEREFAIIGEVIGTFAQQNIEAMQKWDVYIKRKGANIKQLKTLTQQIERIQENSERSELEMIHNLKEYFHIDIEDSKSQEASESQNE